MLIIYCKRKWYDLLLCQHLVQLLILLIRKTRAPTLLNIFMQMLYVEVVLHDVSATCCYTEVRSSTGDKFLWLKRAFKPHLSWSWFSCNDRSKQAQIPATETIIFSLVTFLQETLWRSWDSITRQQPQSEALKNDSFTWWLCTTWCWCTLCLVSWMMHAAQLFMFHTRKNLWPSSTPFSCFPDVLSTYSQMDF